MYEKVHSNFKSPDLSKLKEVVIDVKTKIYIPVDADPEEAKSRFLLRLGEKSRTYLTPKKEG